MTILSRKNFEIWPHLFSQFLSLWTSFLNKLLSFMIKRHKYEFGVEKSNSLGKSCWKLFLWICIFAYRLHSHFWPISTSHNFLSFKARNKLYSSLESLGCPLFRSISHFEKYSKTAKIGDPGKILPFFGSRKSLFGK